MSPDFKSIAAKLGFAVAAREDLHRRLVDAIDRGDVIPGGCDRNGLGEVERYLRGVAADPGARHLMRPSSGGGAGSAPAPPTAPERSLSDPKTWAEPGAVEEIARTGRA